MIELTIVLGKSYLSHNLRCQSKMRQKIRFKVLGFVLQAYKT